MSEEYEDFTVSELRQMGSYLKIRCYVCYKKPELIQKIMEKENKLTPVQMDNYTTFISNLLDLELQIKRIKKEQKNASAEPSLENSAEHDDKTGSKTGRRKKFLISGEREAPNFQEGVTPGRRKVHRRVYTKPVREYPEEEELIFPDAQKYVPKGENKFKFRSSEPESPDFQEGGKGKLKKVPKRTHKGVKKQYSGEQEELKFPEVQSFATRKRNKFQFGSSE